MTREEKVKNLLTELIDMIDNGSQRDLDRADEIAKYIVEVIGKTPCCSIPFLMHIEMDIPISECQKAYEIAMEYLKFQSKIKG